MAAPGTFTLYKANIADLRENDLASANLRMALITSAYTVGNATTAGDALFAAMSANEISSATTGYTAGGYALTGVVAANAGNTGWKLSTGNPVWTAGASNLPVWRYGVLYYLGTLWGKVNPVIGYFLGDATPADVPVTTAGNTCTITCPATGWFDAVPTP